MCVCAWCVSSAVLPYCCTAAGDSHGSGICCIWCAEQLHRKLAVYSTKAPLTLQLGFFAWALLHSSRWKKEITYVEQTS
jgi:hypothetical protein